MEACIRTDTRQTPRVPCVFESDFYLKMLMAYNKHIFATENTFIFSTIRKQNVQITHFLHFNY